MRKTRLIAAAAAALVWRAVAASCIVREDNSSDLDGIMITYKPGSGASGQYPHEFIENYRKQGLEHYWLPTAGGTAAIAHNKGWLLSYWQGDDGLKYQAGQDVINLGHSLVLTGVWSAARSDLPEEIHGTWTCGDGGEWVFSGDSVTVPIEPVAGGVFTAGCVGPVIYAKNDELAFILGLYELLDENTLTIRLNDQYFRGPVEAEPWPAPPESLTLQR